MNARSPSAVQVFRPPARWAWLYGLAALFAAGGLGWTALRAWHARGQSDFALWLALAAGAAFLLPWLAFGWWWTRQVTYRLDADTLSLYAPGAQAHLPLENLVWAGVVAHYDRPLPAPPRGWPGLMVGLVAQPEGATVAFYGLQRARMVVLEDADARVFVLTPADPAAFLAALRARLDDTPVASEPDAGANEAASARPEAMASAPTAAAHASAAEPAAASPAVAPAPRAEPVPQTPSRGPAWVARGLVVVAWLVTLAGVAWAYPRVDALPVGLQYALYAHLVTLGAETGAGHYLLAARREAHAYALWAAGLLTSLGVGWALATQTLG